MRTAPSGLCQSFRSKKGTIKSFTLLLRTRILPIRTERVTERSLLPGLCTALQLLYQCLAGVQTRKQCFCILAPKHSTMLHARP
jgi:hypothetical protein